MNKRLVLPFVQCLFFLMTQSNIKTWLTGVLIDAIRNSGWLRHSLTKERFDFIVNWINDKATIS